MTVLLAIRALAKRAWTWLTLHWKWLLPPIAALIWLLTRQKKVVVASGEIVGHDQVVANADAEAAKEVAAARADEAASLKKIEDEHATAVYNLDKQIKADADKALSDPDATNSFLKEVGESMRK